MHWNDFGFAHGSFLLVYDDNQSIIDCSVHNFLVTFTAPPLLLLAILTSLASSLCDKHIRESKVE